MESIKTTLTEYIKTVKKLDSYDSDYVDLANEYNRLVKQYEVAGRVNVSNAEIIYKAWKALEDKRQERQKLLESKASRETKIKEYLTALNGLSLTINIVTDHIHLMETTYGFHLENGELKYWWNR